MFVTIMPVAAGVVLAAVGAMPVTVGFMFATVGAMLVTSIVPGRHIRTTCSRL